MTEQHTLSTQTWNKHHRSVGYYRFPDNESMMHVREDSIPLVVNCTGIVDIPLGFSTHVYNGREDYYLLYMTGGSLDAEISGEKLFISAGDIAIIPPGNEYHYTKSSTDAVRYHWAHFTGGLADSLLKRFGFEGVGVWRVGLDDGLTVLFLSLIEDFIRRDEYYLESAAASLTEIIIGARRRLDSMESARADSIGRIFNSIKYIHDNFKNPITNDKLAGIEHLSVSQYISLFRKCTGTTPRSYVIELRIRSACDLLLNSDLNISQIAEAVGYDDPHYFSRIFKTHRGIPPEAYRKDSSFA